MELSRILIAIAIMALTTFATRVLPFLFFRNKEVPKVVLFLEDMIPPMIMLILVIYCLKDVKWAVYPYGGLEVISVALVAGLHIWKRNALLSIFGGTLFYMFLVQSGVVVG